MLQTRRKGYDVEEEQFRLKKRFNIFKFSA